MGMVSAALMLGACNAATPQASEESAAELPRGGQPLACPQTGAALQVLGSGGPIAEGARAGTSYLLWIDGEARLLIDAGAGSFLRFGEAGASVETLEGILLTHLHSDHVGDLAGLLKSGSFEDRTAPLPIVGPDGAPRFLGTTQFLTRLLDKESGVYGYLGGYLDGSEGKPMIEPRDIASAGGEGEAVGLDISNDVSVIAYPVNHGPVPALGYDIEVAGKRIIITGDQSAQSTGFAQGLAGTKPDILFAHHVINGEPGQPTHLHRTPAQIGELAEQIQPQNLVLTHNMTRSLNAIEGSLEAIGAAYQGPVSVASDLDCYPL